MSGKVCGARVVRITRRSRFGSALSHRAPPRRPPPRAATFPPAPRCDVPAAPAWGSWLGLCALRARVSAAHVCVFAWCTDTPLAFLAPPPQMRFNMQRGPGLSSLLKSGYKTMSGVEEAIVKNIEACHALAEITRTSLGPNGTLRTPLPHTIAAWACSACCVGPSVANTRAARQCNGRGELSVTRAACCGVQARPVSHSSVCPPAMLAPRPAQA